MKSNLLTLCLIISVVLAACSSNDVPQQDTDTTVKAFAKGADLSWVTEMEADGQKFYNEAGEETDCFTLMKDLGMNAIRLRVWVNPDDTYGPYCNIEDVTDKAVRAQEAGLDLMIDFHYSDFFADPGKQTKPDGWKDKNMDELKSAVAAHTSDVLKALKENGVSSDEF